MDAILARTLEGFATLIVRLKLQCRDSSGHVPHENRFECVGETVLHRPPHQQITRDHPSAIRLLYAWLAAHFFLQNVARVLRGVGRQPHIYGSVVSSSRPPVRIESG